jgi:Mrp family chromosome partitioning ATPase
MARTKETDVEKLQSALAKARQKRGTTDPAVKTPDAEPPKSVSGSGMVPAKKWEGLIPLELDPEVLTRNRVVTLNAVPEATHFDILRTKIILTMRRHGWRRLAITSPTALCGKTTTIANLCAGFSRQPDIKTILFDLDLRRPALHKLLGYHPATSITKLLREEVRLEEQAVRISDNVALSLASGPAKDPTQYLMSDQTVKVLDDIEATHQPDLMLFDMPPLLVGDDTRAFLKNVDCAILIVRAEETTAAQIKVCQQEIGEHTNMLGAVLTQVRYLRDVKEDDYY